MIASQDAHSTVLGLDEDTAFFGVYDGHGRIGEKVSEFVIQNLPGALSEQLGEGPMGTSDPYDHAAPQTLD